MHLIVFDVDGTLVDSKEFDDRLYELAVQTVLGIEIDNDFSRYQNVTDSGILDEIIDIAKIKTDRCLVHKEVKDTFFGMVADYINGLGGQLPEISGAREFVNEIKSNPETAVALATGGWKESAMMKLRAIGLDSEELCLASASDAVSRIEIMRIAEQRALPFGHTGRRTYFGDGPWDKKACQELGYDFIAIGENVENPTRYHDFDDPEAILRQMGLR